MTPSLVVLPGTLLGALWLLVLSTPVLGWLLAAWAIGPGPGSRLRRAAIPVGTAALAVLGLVALVRLAEAASDAMRGGPLGWLAAVLGTPAGGWFPLDAVLVFSWLYAALFPFLCLPAALFHRRPGARSFRVPLPRATAAVLALAAVLAVFAADEPYRALPDAILLDLAAVLPMVLVALAIWTQAERLPPADRPAAEAPAGPAERPTIDPLAIWRRMGAVKPPGEPLVEVAGAEPPPVAGWSAWAWAHAGAFGASPRALDEISSRWTRTPANGPGAGWLVGDLPDPTERLFLVSALLLAVLRDAIPTLVVTRDPAGLRERLLAALGSAGAWSPGPIVAGEAEFRERLAGGRAPVAAFLSVEDLSAEAIRALWAKDQGQPWARGVGLVVLAGVDRGPPIEVTHRLFTLLRLGLALRAAGARFNALATGFGGVGALRLVLGAFPGIQVAEVPFGGAARVRSRAFVAEAAFVEGPGDPWPKRALAPIVERGLPAAVGDPAGAFDRLGVGLWGGDLQIVRDIAMGGVASASALDPAWLFASFRAMANRVPTAAGETHDALWGVASTPVSRFVLRDGYLADLHDRGRLPPPRPLVGRANRFLATAHLRAALGEGAQDRTSLERLFGAPLVERALGPGAEPERFVLRALPGSGELERVPLAGSLDGVRSPLRRTVTDQIVRIVDAQGSGTLDEVDRAVAPTRFYPHRIFAARNGRYEVPLNAFDEKRQEIRVRPVDAHRPLTRPQLRTRLEGATEIETSYDLRHGRLAARVIGLEATAEEAVHGVIAEGTGATQSYAQPVLSRYRTCVRAILFPSAPPANVLFHLARSLDGVLAAHLLAGDDDIEVIAQPAGLLPGYPPGVVVVDRHVQGMGVLQALDDSVIAETLKWVDRILFTCKCVDGCRECTPPVVLAAGPDKAGVLRLLGR